MKKSSIFILISTAILTGSVIYVFLLSDAAEVCTSTNNAEITGNLTLQSRQESICQHYNCPETSIAPGSLVVNPLNPQYFSISGQGTHFMAGAGDPENFLYRGLKQKNGSRKGDQQEIISRLSQFGVNGIYFQIVRSHGGDDKKHGDNNPFINADPSLDLNADVLDQWDTWMTRLDENHIVSYVFFYDDGARVWGEKGGGLCLEEVEFIRTIVDRFKHIKNLVWVVAEEFEEAFTVEEVKQFAAYIKAFDEYSHPVSVHRLNGSRFDEFLDTGELDQYAIQFTSDEPGKFNRILNELWSTSKDSKFPFNLNLAEGHGSETDTFGLGDYQADKARLYNWAIAMAGSNVMVLGMDVINTSDAELKELGLIAKFMNQIDLSQMSPDNSLATGVTQYVLSDQGNQYIAYTNEPGEIGIKSIVKGRYRLLWFDAITGQQVVEIVDVSKSGTLSLQRPEIIGREVAVRIKKINYQLADNPDNELLDTGMTN